jgi:class 3 adenylate cyclase
MSESENAGMEYISSTKLLARTGISRATMNNYIKMGMIHPPIVKKPDDFDSKAKRIGYFGVFVVATIENIRLYKKEGRAMKEIVSLLSLKNDDIRTNEDDSGICGIVPAFAAGRETFHGNDPQSGDENSRQGTCADAGERLPTLVSFSVLVADLQDSMKICAELPPEEYFALIHQIWKSMEVSFKRYCGTYGKYNGNGVVYYFLKDRNANYLMNAIFCAVECRESMKRISDEWKATKGWSSELYLNIGINESEEYFAPISESPTIEFMSIGGAAHCAMHLSELARSGSIWTTKSLMNRLDEVKRKNIRYGIHRDSRQPDIPIENIFSRIMDLIPRECIESNKLIDIASLSVTEVLDLR